MDRPFAGSAHCAVQFSGSCAGVLPELGHVQCPRIDSRQHPMCEWSRILGIRWDAHSILGAGRLVD